MKRRIGFPMVFILVLCLGIASFTSPVAAYIFTGSGSTNRYLGGWPWGIVVATCHSNAEVDTYYHTMQLSWDGPAGWFDGYHLYTWAGLTTIYMCDDKGWSFPCPVIFSMPGQYSGSWSFGYPNYYTTLHIAVGWTYVGITITGGPCVDQIWVNYDVEVGAPGSGGGGGGGCPTLFVWNGSDYNDFGVIDIHANEDVAREVSVPSESVGINNYKAQFRLREGWEGLTYSHSEIDQVKLYALDSEGSRHVCPLIEATHSELGNVLPQLLLSDDWKCNIYLLETIDLKFVVPCQTYLIQDFVFMIEGCNMLKY